MVLRILLPGLHAEGILEGGLGQVQFVPFKGRISFGHELVIPTVAFLGLLRQAVLLGLLGGQSGGLVRCGLIGDAVADGLQPVLRVLLVGLDLSGFRVGRPGGVPVLG